LVHKSFKSNAVRINLSLFRYTHHHVGIRSLLRRNPPRVQAAATKHTYMFIDTESGIDVPQSAFTVLHNSLHTSSLTPLTLRVVPRLLGIDCKGLDCPLPALFLSQQRKEGPVWSEYWGREKLCRLTLSKNVAGTRSPPPGPPSVSNLRADMEIHATAVRRIGLGFWGRGRTLEFILSHYSRN
jgi:hypothetical protein